MVAMWFFLVVFSILFSPLVAGDDSDGLTRVSLARSPVHEVPAVGSLELTCRTTTRGPQMRVLVQRPSDPRRVTHTLSHLVSTGDYHVHITDALLVSVTIRDVTQHNGTSYACVQYFDDAEYVSDTFRLVLPSPVAVNYVVKDTRLGLNINIHWKIENPMTIDTFSALLSCDNAWEDSQNLDAMDRETFFRTRQTDFGHCNATVKGVRNGVTVAMGTTSVQSEPDIISSFGGFDGLVMVIILITFLLLVLTVVLVIAVVCVSCRRRKKISVVPSKQSKGDHYSQLINSYQVVDGRKVTPPPTYQQIEKVLDSSVMA